jgi:hypothetical protein
MLPDYGICFVVVSLLAALPAVVFHPEFCLSATLRSVDEAKLLLNITARSAAMVARSGPDTWSPAWMCDRRMTMTNLLPEKVDGHE